tara:strand:- start:3996 stop:5771 length:1776 start_codon:yes stop_codon:yes gene_type:complete
MSSIIKLEREVLINSDKIKSLQTLSGIESEQLKYLTSVVTSIEGGTYEGGTGGGGISQATLDNTLGGYATTAYADAAGGTGGGGISQATLDNTLSTYALNTTVYAIAVAAQNESQAATNYTDSLVGHSATVPAFDTSGNHTVTLNSATAYADSVGGLDAGGVQTLITGTTITADGTGQQANIVMGDTDQSDLPLAPYGSKLASAVNLTHVPYSQVRNYVQYGPIPTFSNTGSSAYPGGDNVLRGFDALRPTIQDTSFIIVTHEEFPAKDSQGVKWFTQAPSAGKYICELEYTEPNWPYRIINGWHQLEGWIIPSNQYSIPRTRLQNPNYSGDVTASSSGGPGFAGNDPYIHPLHPRNVLLPAVGRDLNSTRTTASEGFRNKWPITINREGFYRITINIAFITEYAMADSAGGNSGEVYNALAFQLLAIPAADHATSPINKKGVGPIGFTNAVRNFQYPPASSSPQDQPQDRPQIGHGSLSFIYKTPGDHPAATGGMSETFTPLVLGVQCSRIHGEGCWAGWASAPDSGGSGLYTPTITFINPYAPVGSLGGNDFTGGDSVVGTKPGHPATANSIQAEFIHGIAPANSVHSI